MIIIGLAGVFESGGTDSTVYTSNGLIGFIERHEGFSATEYRGADLQNLTIGYGHVDYSGQYYGATLTPKEADDLLRSDLLTYELSVSNEFNGVTLEQYQRDALVDFAYNLGANIWPKASKLVGDVKSGASSDVLKSDFVSWDVCNGNTLKGLYSRRYDEWMLYCCGDYGE